MKSTAPVSKILSVSLSILLCLTHSVWPYPEAPSIWAERAKQKTKTLQFARLPPKAIAFPSSLTRSNLARLLDSIKASGSAHPLVIHIKDAHGNVEAQTHISRLIRQISQSVHVDVVAVEGGFGPLDLQAFRTYDHPQCVRLSADYLLKTRRLSGVIHSLITFTNNAPPLIGVDDAETYQANVDAFKEASESAEQIAKTLLKRQKILNQKRRNRLNPDLLKFTALVEAYRTRHITLGQYTDELLHQWKTHLLKLNSFPHIQTFLNAYHLEKTINFERARNERTRLISKLLKELQPDERDQFLSQSHARRSIFCDDLIQMAQKKGLSLKNAAELEKYIRYASAAEKIDGEKVFAEIQSMKEEICNALIQTQKERRVMEDFEIGALIRKLVNFSLTRHEWERYKRVVSALNVEFPPPREGHLFSDRTPESGFRRSDGALESFESFYRLAEKRDDAIAQNLIQAIHKRSARVAILVTGGFHAEGIQRHLKKRGILVRSIVPKITKIEKGNTTSYLRVFSQGKTPLDKLFEGDTLFLSPRVWTRPLKNRLALLTLGLQKQAGALNDPQKSYERLTRHPGTLLKSIFKIAHNVYILLSKPKRGWVLFSLKSSEKNIVNDTEEKIEFPKLSILHPTQWAALQNAIPSPPHIQMLGGAREVGGFSVLLEMGKKNIVIDAGYNQQADGRNPFLDPSQIKKLDAIFITHAHLDHVGSLPLLHKKFPDVPIYASLATIHLMKINLLSSYKIMRGKANSKNIPFERDDIGKMLQKTVPIDWEKTYRIGKYFTVRPYRAGHIPGAMTFEFTSLGGRIVVSGDLSFQNQNTVSGGEKPSPRPDLLLLEGIAGVRPSTDRKAEETRMIDLIAETLKRGGSILIPALALGRSQEVLTILRDAQEQGLLPSKAELDIYTDGLAISYIKAYELNRMFLSKEREKIMARNFGSLLKGEKSNIRSVVSPEDRARLLRNLKGQKGKPMIIVAPSGMLAGGHAIPYAAAILPHENNLVLQVNYQVENLAGRRLAESEKGDTLVLDGAAVTIKATVRSIILSAHASGPELVDYARDVNPVTLALVHGNHLKGLQRLLRKKGGSALLPKKNQVISIRPRVGRRLIQRWAKLILTRAPTLPIPSDRTLRKKRPLSTPEEFPLPTLTPSDLLKRGQLIAFTKKGAAEVAIVSEDEIIDRNSYRPASIVRLSGRPEFTSFNRHSHPLRRFVGSAPSLLSDPSAPSDLETAGAQQIQDRLKYALTLVGEAIALSEESLWILAFLAYDENFPHEGFRLEDLAGRLLAAKIPHIKDELAKYFDPKQYHPEILKRLPASSHRTVADAFGRDLKAPLEMALFLKLSRFSKFFSRGASSGYFYAHLPHMETAGRKKIDHLIKLTKLKPGSKIIIKRGTRLGQRNDRELLVEDSPAIFLNQWGDLTTISIPGEEKPRVFVLKSSYIEIPASPLPGAILPSIIILLLGTIAWAIFSTLIPGSSLSSSLAVVPLTTIFLNTDANKDFPPGSVPRVFEIMAREGRTPSTLKQITTWLHRSEKPIKRDINELMNLGLMKIDESGKSLKYRLISLSPQKRVRIQQILNNSYPYANPRRGDNSPEEAKTNIREELMEFVFFKLFYHSRADDVLRLYEEKFRHLPEENWALELDRLGEVTGTHQDILDILRKMKPKEAATIAARVRETAETYQQDYKDQARIFGYDFDIGNPDENKARFQARIRGRIRKDRIEQASKKVSRPQSLLIYLAGHLIHTAERKFSPLLNQHIYSLGFIHWKTTGQSFEMGLSPQPRTIYLMENLSGRNSGEHSHRYFRIVIGKEGGVWYHRGKRADKVMSAPPTATSILERRFIDESILKGMASELFNGIRLRWWEKKLWELFNTLIFRRRTSGSSREAASILEPLTYWTDVRSKIPKKMTFTLMDPGASWRPIEIDTTDPHHFKADPIVDNISFIRKNSGDLQIAGFAESGRHTTRDLEKKWFYSLYFSLRFMKTNRPPHGRSPYFSSPVFFFVDQIVGKGGMKGALRRFAQKALNMKWPLPRYVIMENHAQRELVAVRLTRRKDEEGLTKVDLEDWPIKDDMTVMNAALSQYATIEPKEMEAYIDDLVSYERGKIRRKRAAKKASLARHLSTARRAAQVLPVFLLASVLLLIVSSAHGEVMAAALALPLLGGWQPAPPFNEKNPPKRSRRFRPIVNFRVGETLDGRARRGEPNSEPTRKEPDPLGTIKDRWRALRRSL